MSSLFLIFYALLEHQCFSVVSIVLVNFEWSWNCLYVDWMECQGWDFKKYWFCSGIRPCHIKIRWLKEMVGTSLPAFHYTGRIIQNIVFSFTQSEQAGSIEWSWFDATVMFIGQSWKRLNSIGKGGMSYLNLSCLLRLRIFIVNIVIYFLIY